MMTKCCEHQYDDAHSAQLNIMMTKCCEHQYDDAQEHKERYSPLKSRGLALCWTSSHPSSHESSSLNLKKKLYKNPSKIFNLKRLAQNLLSEAFLAAVGHCSPYAKKWLSFSLSLEGLHNVGGSSFKVACFLLLRFHTYFHFNSGIYLTYMQWQMTLRGARNLFLSSDIEHSKQASPSSEPSSWPSSEPSSKPSTIIVIPIWTFKH